MLKTLGGVLILIGILGSLWNLWAEGSGKHLICAEACRGAGYDDGGLLLKITVPKCWECGCNSHRTGNIPFPVEALENP